MKLNDRLRSFLGIPLTVVAFLFIGKIFFDNKEQIFVNLSRVNPELFLLGVLFYATFFCVKSYVWIKILAIRGKQPNVYHTLFYYSLSELKRYIPGSIFAFLGRMSTHESEIGKKETLKGIGIEAILLVSSAISVSLPAILYFLGKSYNSLPHVLIASLLLSSLAVIFFVLFGRKIVKTIGIYIDSFALFLLAWSLYGLGSFFIFLSLTFSDVSNLLIISSFFVLAWVSGYLFFIVPMGLGVREIITVFGLSFFIAAPIASVIAIMARLGMILGELLYLAITYILKRSKGNFLLLRINPYLAIVIVLGIIYFAFFSYYSFAKHDNYLTGRFDLGNMSQTVWNTYHGNFFRLSNPDGVNEISRLGVHSDFFLILIAPFYFLWEDPKVLLLLQSLSLAVAGIFVYLLSRQITKREVLSVVFAASFYSNFWIHEQNLFDFHAVSIATLFLLGSLYFILVRRNVLFLIFIITAASTKENVLLAISIFGLYYMKKGKWVAGLFLTLVPIIAFFYLTSAAIPNARGEAHFALGTYQNLGDSTGNIVKNIILNPSIAFSQVFNFSTLKYFHNHLVSTGYLALLSPFYLLFTIPDMAIYLLSSNYGYRSYQYHFGAVIVPFVYVAAMFSVKKILDRWSICKPLCYYLVIVTLVTLYLYSPIPGMKNGEYVFKNLQNRALIRSFLANIPPNATVSASNNIGAHLSHRKEIYVIPFGINKASYIVLYQEDPKTISSINTLQYETLIEDNALNFYLFRRISYSPCNSCEP